MKYKIIFCDFDGTLLRDDLTVSQKNRDAVNDYVAAGGKFVITTGRLYEAIRLHVKSLGLKSDVIACQGAEIFDSADSKLLDVAMQRQAAVECAEYLESVKGGVCAAYIDDECVARKPDRYIDLLLSVLGVECRYVGQSLAEYIASNGGRVSKLVVLSDAETMDAVLPAAAAKFAGRISVARSGSFIAEFLTEGVDKGSALLYLARKYGVAAEDTLAVGDSGNDVPMLAAAGLGIAVSNARAEAKEAADIVWNSSNDEDAVAEIIAKYCLGGD